MHFPAAPRRVFPYGADNRLFYYINRIRLIQVFLCFLTRRGRGSPAAQKKGLPGGSPFRFGFLFYISSMSALKAGRLRRIMSLDTQVQMRK